MENASKALIMASGVLIALLVIGILVFFFNNLKDLQSINQSVETTEQAAEFNKQYDVYARDVYGSELLSLAQKIEDYNERESDMKGYSKIELQVKFNTTLSKEFFLAKEYNSVTLNEEVKNVKKEVKKYSDRTKTDMVFNSADGTKTRTVSQLATMRTIERKEYFDLDENDEKNSKYYRKYDEANKKIQEYNQIKNLLSEIKQHVFIFNGIEYDDENTGRVTLMKYEYNEK